MTDTGDKIDPIGLTKEDLTTWTFDAIADVVARYAEPSVTFDMRVATLDERSREALVAGPGNHAVEGARELFIRFGWEVDPELLRTLLREGGLTA